MRFIVLNGRVVVDGKSTLRLLVAVARRYYKGELFLLSVLFNLLSDFLDHSAGTDVNAFSDLAPHLRKHVLLLGFVVVETLQAWLGGGPLDRGVAGPDLEHVDDVLKLVLLVESGVHYLVALLGNHCGFIKQNKLINSLILLNQGSLSLHQFVVVVVNRPCNLVARL